MFEIGCHYAAWIRGSFILLLFVFFSACSDEQDPVVAQKNALLTTTNNQLLAQISATPSKNKKRPFSQLLLDNMAVDYPYTPDDSFRAFIRKLSVRIDNKNSKALSSELSPRFSCQSSSCEEGLPITEQFLHLIKSLGQQRWKHLLGLIQTDYYQYVDDHICGPAKIIFRGDKAGRLEEKNWAYVKGKNVRLRQRANKKSKIVAHLSYDAVKLLSPNIIKRQGIPWVEVETLTEQEGFISKQYLLTLSPQQVCYQEMEGEWKISAFRDTF